jgi:hypothetical protein
MGSTFNSDVDRSTTCWSFKTSAVNCSSLGDRERLEVSHVLSIEFIVYVELSGSTHAIF